jgi:hypothetical protein
MSPNGLGERDEPSMPDEVALTGGSVSNVVRIGDTVRRPTGWWTPAVHALLRYLEDVGFTEAPRVLGFDDEGREIVTYIPGRVGRRPWPPALRDHHGLREIARLLARYHDAVDGFSPPADAKWRTGQTGPGKSGGLVSHGDLGPWNTIWRDDRVVGLIDWDFAEPRRPVEDLAEVAWYFVPLQGRRIWKQAGFREPPEARDRLHVLCDTYGRFSPREVVNALEKRQRLERSRTRTLGSAGHHPWATFLARGDVEQMDEESRWLAEHRNELID